MVWPLGSFPRSCKHAKRIRSSTTNRQPPYTQVRLPLHRDPRDPLRHPADDSVLRGPERELRRGLPGRVRGLPHEVSRGTRGVLQQASVARIARKAYLSDTGDPLSLARVVACRLGCAPPSPPLETRAALSRALALSLSLTRVPALPPSLPLPSLALLHPGGHSRTLASRT